jgi:hypothetical protein
VENVGKIMKAIPALLGENDATARTLKQLDVEELLELADLMTDGRRRHAQLASCAAEIQMAAGSFKGMKGFQWWQASRHGIHHRRLFGQKCSRRHSWFKALL